MKKKYWRCAVNEYGKNKHDPKGNELKMLQQNKCNFNTPTKSVFQKENLSNGGSDSLKKILLKSTT